MSQVSDNSKHDSPSKPAAPTRAEIESMCLVSVLARGSCSLADLAERLGFTRELGDQLEPALEELRAAERVSIDAVAVAATPAGVAWLRGRLAELGCDGAVPQEPG